LVNKKNDTDPKEAGAVNVKYTPYSWPPYLLVLQYCNIMRI
jgi:hypothetical protein